MGARSLGFLVASMMTLLVVLQPFVAAQLPPVYVDKWYIHVANRLSNGILYAHCKSRDNDVGQFNLNHGAEIQWSFKENVWGTTLFWCFLRKPNGASVSFEAFWHETNHYWLHYRCTNDGTCIWTAKDDGVYLRNIPDGVDELIHKWSV